MILFLVGLSTKLIFEYFNLNMVMLINIFYIYNIYKMDLLSEGVIVGLVVIIVGLLTKKILNYLEINLPDEYEEYIVLFLIGFISHILFEYIGFNKWYCEHGNACN